jgi:RNA polymerase sigma-70 factor (ECF subfamily)
VRSLDEHRFAAVFDRCYPAVLAYARRRAAEPEAEEAALATFEVAWRRRSELPTEPLPWLYGVARRTLANQRRADRRRSRLVDRLGRASGAPDSASAEPDSAAVATSALAARAALEQLRPEDRELLMLVAWEGLDAASVSQVLDISPGAVAVRLHRARRRLESLLPPLGEPGELRPAERPSPQRRSPERPSLSPELPATDPHATDPHRADPHRADPLGTQRDEPQRGQPS